VVCMVICSWLAVRGGRRGCGVRGRNDGRNSVAAVGRRSRMRCADEASPVQNWVQISAATQRALQRDLFCHSRCRVARHAKSAVMTREPRPNPPSFLAPIRMMDERPSKHIIAIVVVLAWTQHAPSKLGEIAEHQPVCESHRPTSTK
jgi:hypothetical protein